MSNEFMVGDRKVTGDDVKALLADGPQAAESFVLEVAEEFIRSERKPVAAANATFLAVSSGWLHTGRVSDDNPKADGQMGLKEFGEWFATKVGRKDKDGKVQPYQSSTVTQWLVAGWAYNIHGIDPDKQVGKDLVARYGQFGGVRETVMGPDGKKTTKVSEKAIRDAIDKRKAEEKRAADKRAEKAADEKARAAANLPKNVAAAVEFIQMTLASLSTDDGKNVLSQVTTWFEKDGAVESLREQITKAAAEQAPAEETPAA